MIKELREVDDCSILISCITHENIWVMETEKKRND
jgi:hypothetical protein